jgi:hypothetical protein
MEETKHPCAATATRQRRPEESLQIIKRDDETGTLPRRCGIVKTKQLEQ